MDSNSANESPPDSPLASPLGSPYLGSTDPIISPKLTPLSSKEEDYAFSSDSDIASLSSSDLLVRSPQRRERLDSTGSYSRSSDREGGPQTPKSPRLKKNLSQTPNSRSRSRSKRRLSKAKEELPPAATIFKDLLILEESLRQQVSTHKSLRNKYMSFLTILSFILGVCTYDLLFSIDRPTGFARVARQFVALIILVTLFLYYISGEYQRTVVAPRKFLSSTNKGLRQLNVRLTKVRTPWSDKVIDTIRAIVRVLAGFAQTMLELTGPIAKLEVVKKCARLISAVENRAQPRVGATEVKLVLNPRVFSTNIRENWEMYRNEFWAREGARRRGEKTSITSQENMRRELIDRDRRERKERRLSKLNS